MFIFEVDDWEFEYYFVVVNWMWKSFGRWFLKSELFLEKVEVSGWKRGVWNEEIVGCFGVWYILVCFIVEIWFGLIWS